jgi:hypothetical protein
MVVAGVVGRLASDILVVAGVKHGEWKGKRDLKNRNRSPELQLFE